MTTNPSNNQEALITKVIEQNPELSHSLVRTILEADAEKATEEYKFS